MSLQLSGHKFAVGDEVVFPYANSEMQTVTRLVTSVDDVKYQQAKRLYSMLYGQDFECCKDGGSILGPEPGPVYLVLDECGDVVPAYETEMRAYAEWKALAETQ